MDVSAGRFSISKRPPAVRGRVFDPPSRVGSGQAPSAHWRPLRRGLSDYRDMVGDHAPHPGTGKGRGAQGLPTAFKKAKAAAT